MIWAIGSPHHDEHHPIVRTGGRPRNSHMRTTVHNAWTTSLAIVVLGLRSAEAVPIDLSNSNRYSSLLFDPASIQSVTNVTYGPDAKHTFDVFYPSFTVDPTSNRAAFVYIHGGGFTAGDKSEGTQICKEMARRGYVTATINYRLSSTNDPLITAIQRAVEDSKLAVDFLLTRASTYGFNTNYIALHGSSAGGIAIVDMCYWDIPPFAPWANKSRVFAAAPNCGGDGVLSVGLYVPTITTDYAPPAMLIHNTGDTVVPYSGTPTLVNELSDENIYFSVYNPPGGHCATPWATYSPTLVKFYYKMLHGVYAQRDGFERMEAETCNEKSPSLNVAACPDVPEGGQCVTNFTTPVDYIAFYNVDCGKQASRMLIRMSTSPLFSTGTLELRIGHPNGFLMGTLSEVGTGGPHLYGTQSAIVSAISTNKGALMGVHDLFFVSKTPGINLNWVTLSALPTNIQPSIDNQPLDAGVDAGQSATFSVTASGVPAPTLQWHISRDDGARWTNILGATNSSYTTGPVSAYDHGSLFRCLASSLAGDAQSDAAALVYEPWQNWQLENFGSAGGAESDFDSDPDHDGYGNFSEFIADTNPTNPASFFVIQAISDNPCVPVHFISSSNRLYTLVSLGNLHESAWSNVPGAGPRLGAGGVDFMKDTNVPPHGPFFRILVELPQGD